MKMIIRLGGLYNQVTRWGIYSIYGLMPTLTAAMGCGGGHTPMFIYEENNMKRIRKLTPKECWRLQGFSVITKTDDGYEFDDSLFERAEKVNSNCQLYKQAGNSITVDVLVAIMRNLFQDNTETKPTIIESDTQFKLYDI